MRRLLPILAAAMALGGCARFPSVPPDAGGTKLIFTMTVDGALRFGTEPGSAGVPYVYMVAIATSTDDNPTTLGPVPIIAPPWGNGFVAETCTHFVWWDPTQASPFTLYQFRDSTLEQWFPIGVPVNYELPEPGSKRLRFELALSQLAPSPADAAKLRTIQVNFLTMDRIPTGGSTKAWEALGDGRLPIEVNTTKTIPLRTSGTYNNAKDGNIEPRGDQPNPDLDVVDWSVEVRVQ